MNVDRTKLTPAEIARMWGISTDKVLAWIHSGELRAINVAANPRGRPRFRVDLNDLRAFEAMRTVGGKEQPRRRLNRKRDGVIEFF